MLHNVISDMFDICDVDAAVISFSFIIRGSSTRPVPAIAAIAVTIAIACSQHVKVLGWDCRLEAPVTTLHIRVLLIKADVLVQKK